MVRIIFAVIVIFGATFFLPFWMQIIFYVVAIFLVRYHALLLIPALFADAWYAPTRELTPSNNKTILVVIGLILIYLFIMRTTRIKERYDLEKK